MEDDKDLVFINEPESTEKPNKSGKSVLNTVIITLSAVITLTIIFLILLSVSFSTGKKRVKKEKEIQVEEVSEAADVTVSNEETFYTVVASFEIPLYDAPLGDEIKSVFAGEKFVPLENGEEAPGFIYVKSVDGGETGYIAEEYVVKSNFAYDLSELDLVNIKSARYTYENMTRDIKRLSVKYPDIISYEIIGESVAGNKLYAVTFGGKEAGNHIMIQASIHGREYMNTQLVMKLIEYYAYYYDTGVYNNKSYKSFFDNTNIVIVPMANPDGVIISQRGVKALNNDELEAVIKEAYERDSYYLTPGEVVSGVQIWVDNYKDESFKRNENDKVISFNEYQKLWKANGRAVDLNNNFDAEWDNINLKKEPSFQSYKGESALSEPEAKALTELSGKYEYLCYLSYHSTGQVVYYDCVGNDEEFSNKEKDFAEMISGHLKFTPTTTVGAYNVNLGGFSDYIQLKKKSLSVTIESGYNFCPLEIDEFKPMWLRHRELWVDIIDYILRE